MFQTKTNSLKSNFASPVGFQWNIYLTIKGKKNPEKAVRQVEVYYIQGNQL